MWQLVSGLKDWDFGIQQALPHLGTEKKQNSLEDYCFKYDIVLKLIERLELESSSMGSLRVTFSLRKLQVKEIFTNDASFPDP